MEVDDKEDYSEVMNDPAFLQSVLQNLPGVDPQSEAVKNAMGAIKVTFLDLFYFNQCYTQVLTTDLSCIGTAWKLV